MEEESRALKERLGVLLRCDVLPVAAILLQSVCPSSASFSLIAGAEALHTTCSVRLCYTLQQSMNRDAAVTGEKGGSVRGIEGCPPRRMPQQRQKRKATGGVQGNTRSLTMVKTAAKQLPNSYTKLKASISAGSYFKLVSQESCALNSCVFITRIFLPPHITKAKSYMARVSLRSARSSVVQQPMD